MEVTALSIARDVVTLVVLGYAAYSDVKSREVDDVVWLILAVASATLIFPELTFLERGSMVLYLISVYSAFVLGLALTAFGLMGDADFLAITCLGLVTPPSRFTLFSAIPSISIFVNALIISCAYPLALLIRNLVLLKRGLPLFEDVEISTAGKLLALFTLTKVPLEEFRRKYYAYTLAEVREGERKRILFRARVGENSPQPQGEWVWVSPYIPFVAMLAIGFVIHSLHGCILDTLIQP